MSDHTDVMEAIAGICRLSTETMPLAAIWLEKPLQMAGKRSIRIQKGCVVRVENGSLVDIPVTDYTHQFDATHMVTECRGTIYSTDLQITVRDLKTNELSTIKL